jgi:outer membrane beta-barrel protein
MATMKIRNAVLLALGLCLPAVAQAQELQQRKSPLADAPAVRRRVELRENRFELGVGVGSTIGQDFYHAVLVGPKLAFHLNDWLAIAATAQFNVTKDFRTSLTEQLEGTLDDRPQMDRTPKLSEALGAMNKIGQVIGVNAEVIPFSGKLALFSKLFANYDLYGFGGLGAINFVADRPACTSPGNSCPHVGLKMGANFGVGMRAFFNDFFAINLEARDILLRNNPAGRDVTGDMVADKEDLSWDSNYIVTLNFTFLPSKAKITD